MIYKLIISPKDTTAKIEIAVTFYWQEGNCLCIKLADNGKIRMYPMCHIWYFEVG